MCCAVLCRCGMMAAGCLEVRFNGCGMGTGTAGGARGRGPLVASAHVDVYVKAAAGAVLRSAVGGCSGVPPVVCVCVYGVCVCGGGGVEVPCRFTYCLCSRGRVCIDVCTCGGWWLGWGWEGCVQGGWGWSRGRCGGVPVSSTLPQLSVLRNHATACSSFVVKEKSTTQPAASFLKSASGPPSASAHVDVYVKVLRWVVVAGGGSGMAPPGGGGRLYLGAVVCKRVININVQ
jgi:hypothetical protein